MGSLTFSFSCEGNDGETFVSVVRKIPDSGGARDHSSCCRSYGFLATFLAGFFFLLLFRFSILAIFPSSLLSISSMPF